MAADDVQLPDLEVIQLYSVAVRGASAPRAEVIAALQADLDWLTSAHPAPTAARPPAKRPAAKATPTATPTPAPPRRSPRRTPAKRRSTEA